MDWMDKAMVTSEIAQLVQRMDQARGRIYWRSFSEKVHIPPLTFLNATKVRKEGSEGDSRGRGWCGRWTPVQFNNTTVPALHD